MKTSLLVLGLCFGATSAFAVPTQWTVASGGNGHFYEFIAFEGTVLSWSEARIAALSARFGGVAGHLATITSAEEQAFLVGLNSEIVAWTAGTDAASEGAWVWADGPEAGRQFSAGAVATGPDSFAAWNDVPPDNVEPNGGTGENYLQFNWFVPGGWNDVPLEDPCCTTGYLVEFSTSEVPLPASLPLMLVGTLALGVAGQRRRRGSG